MTTGGPAQAPQPVPARAPAELDRRFYAYVIDRAIGWGLAAGVGALVWFVLDRRTVLEVAGGVLGTLLLVSLLLAVLQGTSGATPGKSLLGIRVVGARTGKAPGIGSSLVRGLLLGAAGLPTAGLGVATLAWTAAMDREDRRRGWHDRVTGSVVVEVNQNRVTGDDGPGEMPRGMVNLTAMRLVPTPDPPTPDPPVPGPAAPAEPRHARDETARPQPAPGAPPPALPNRPPAVPGPSTRSPQEPPAVAAMSRWRVTFDTGETFLVEGLALVGRGPQPRPGEAVQHVVPLRSTDMSLSKTHAQFHVARDGVLVVMDRGSTNGSVLLRRGMSRELAAGKPATLVDGDRVKFGDREMHVARES